MSVRYPFLIAVAAMLGCAPPPGTGAAPRNPSVITDGDIASVNAVTAWDAVSKLHPQWLRSHGEVSLSTPGTDFAVVFVDEQAYGDLSSLRNIQGSQVSEIRYLNGSEGAAKYGLRGGTAGVIEVRLKSG